MKVLIYNSSARGSGQFVRSLKVAQVITNSFRDARCVILAGNSRVERPVPDRTLIPAMPQIRKSRDGTYCLSSLNEIRSTTSLPSVTEAFAVRRLLIQSTIDQYDPDVFLVDSRPAGLNGELQDVLGQLARTSKCRTVLMLRDIVDEPGLVTRRWAQDGTYRLIDEAYEDVVIWGDEQIFDAVAAYGLSARRDKVAYLGYLGSPRLAVTDSDAGDGASPSGRILFTVGGGFDGSGIIETVCAYIKRTSSSDHCLSFTIVLGAHSPIAISDLLARYGGPCRDAEVYSYVPGLEGLISKAAVVVTMCGYNTLVELIERNKRIIAIPSSLGAEQAMRARILSSVYDGMWVIPERELTADALGQLVDSALRSPRPSTQIGMNGAANLTAFLGRRAHAL